MHIDKRYFLLLLCIPLYFVHHYIMYLDTKTPISFSLLCLFAIYITAATALLVIKPLVPKHIVFFGLHLFLFLLIFIQSETIKINKKELLFYFVFLVPSLLLVAILARRKETLAQPTENKNTENADIIRILRFVFFAYLGVSMVFLLFFITIGQTGLQFAFDYVAFIYLLLIVCALFFCIIMKKRKKEPEFRFMNKFSDLMLVLSIYYALSFMLWANQLSIDLILLFFPWFLCLFIILEKPRFKTAV